MSPAAFGLSREEFAQLLESMVGMVEYMGCPDHMSPLEIVQDALMLALANPASERMSTAGRDGFVSWMCTLTKFAVLTNRKASQQRLLGSGTSEDDIGEMLLTAGLPEDTGMRERLRRAMQTLDPEDQELLRMHFVEGKRIQELAKEQNVPWSTMSSRIRRVLKLLRTALEVTVVAVILLWTKNLRAQTMGLARHVVQLVPQATQVACAMTVTAACGVLVPASSLKSVDFAGTLPHEEYVAAVEPEGVPGGSDVPESADRLPRDPRASQLVAPVKPNVVDELATQCSAAEMKTTPIVRYLQATVLPVALLAAPAVTQTACAGSGRQTTQPTQQPEDDEGGSGTDPYVKWCHAQHMWGKDCPSRAEWYESMGYCADGTRDCKK